MAYMLLMYIALRVASIALVRVFSAIVYAEFIYHGEKFYSTSILANVAYLGKILYHAAIFYIT